MLKVGVVGVGYLGSIHARIYARMPDVELVGVVDATADTAQAVGLECECAAYSDTTALLGKVDAVSIAVPTSLHRQVAEPYLNSGTHMLLEKPVAATVADAQAIVDLAEQHHAILQIGHLERFNAGVIELAQRVKQPRFIEATRLGTFVERATDVDVVTDLMIHDIDIVLSLIDAPIQRISAIGTAVVTDQIDIANARIEFTNKAVANFTASRVSAKKFRRLRAFSPNGYHGLDFTHQVLDVVKPKPKQAGERFAGIEQDTVTLEGSPPLDAELRHFVDTINQGGRPLVDGQDGVRALVVANEVVKAIESGLTDLT